MWKAVGTVNPNDNKQNRSKDEVNCQPFGQASKLKINESHLSGQKSHQFLNEYFTKRRSPEGGLHRVLSQKTIEVRQATSPPSSLRLIESLKNVNKTESKVGLHEPSLRELQRQVGARSAEVQKSKPQLGDRCQKIVEELRSVREQQARISKLITSQVGSFRQELALFQKEVAEKLEKLEGERQKSSRQNVNPELLAKLKQEGARFNEKMRELDSRKEQVRGKYKDKVRNQ